MDDVFRGTPNDSGNLQIWFCLASWDDEIHWNSWKFLMGNSEPSITKPSIFTFSSTSKPCQVESEQLIPFDGGGRPSQPRQPRSRLENISGQPRWLKMVVEYPSVVKYPKWGFPKLGYPQIIHFGGIFPNKNHPFLGTPILGNPQMSIRLHTFQWWSCPIPSQQCDLNLCWLMSSSGIVPIKAESL